ncbi:hypothetical protein [Escherichia coli]|uniref:hypothetical protein n=1 Tax=Escherichia coli TaxID=562 RepID=UPI001C1B6C71|nr:hypothetical protein [Escherichia coli]MCG0109099.1 hypothetical protein [Escherichia coli]HBD5700057.1 hypothetical protein [Escherichia coli]HBD5770952.1 hypothetical protein [Escherichia coli]HBD5885967.1 hypothetical protein [Escherichia coli]HBD5895468.1 hypothetical protein [Escherichia coli]
MVEDKEVDKEMPYGADDLITFSGGLYEFETSAGWHDHWHFPTRKELSERKSFGEDAERLANNKWLDKFIAEGGK